MIFDSFRSIVVLQFITIGTGVFEFISDCFDKKTYFGSNFDSAVVLITVFNIKCPNSRLNIINVFNFIIIRNTRCLVCVGFAGYRLNYKR